MPSARKKSPLSTNKKKKPASNKPKSKKSVGRKTALKQDVTGGDVDGSYLHNVSQAMSGGDELLDVHALNVGSEAILNTLKHLEESNPRIVERIDRIEGNSTASSTPIPSGAATNRDNVTFRLPKPKHASPVKNTVGELTP